MKNKMPPARFRRQLKEQLPILESEGLLSSQQSQSIFARYQLDALGSEAMNILLSVIYTIGAVLISIGIISFVAAHWEDIGRSTKVILIFAVMLVAHTAGFYLWQIRGSYPKLGHALVLLGTLIFGANIGLMAQIFHIHSDPFNGFFAWSIGAILLAYAVKSIPNAVLAAIVAIIALFAGVGSDSRYLMPCFPLAAIVIFVPFVYYSKSRWALFSILLLIVLSFPLTLIQNDGEEFGLAAGLALVGALLFAWGTIHHSHLSLNFIASPAWTFGIFAVSLSLYLCSFHEFCTDLIPYWMTLSLTSWANSSRYIILPTSVGIWVSSLRQTKKLAVLLLQISNMLGLILVVGLPWFVQSYTLTFLANLLFIIMIILLFIVSFMHEDRRIFWVSVLMAALLILSRTLEYETQLLIKAIIFTACGIGIIVAGVMFERFLKARRLSHA